MQPGCAALPTQEAAGKQFSPTSFLILWLMSRNRNLSAATCATKVYFASAPGHSLGVVGRQNFGKTYGSFRKVFLGWTWAAMARPRLRRRLLHHSLSRLLVP